MTEERIIHLDQDTRLMLKIAQDDHEAFGVLQSKYVPIIGSYAAKLNGQIEISDVAQEVFTRLWLERKKYRPGSNVKAYILRFARNVVSEQDRSQSQEAKSIKERYACGDLHVSGVQTASAGVDPQILCALNDAISQLPDKEREAVELFHLQQKNLADSSRLTGCSIEAFKGRLRRARARLRQMAANDVLAAWHG